MSNLRRLEHRIGAALATLALASCAVLPLCAAAGRGGAAISRSTTKIGGVELTVVHELEEGGVPPIPDLSRTGETEIPKRSVLETPIGLIWSDRVVSPGRYELGLLVSDDGQIQLNLHPVGGGTPIALALERADYSRPVDGIDLFLMAIDRGDRERGVLQLRWGALLLQGSFAPLRATSSEVKGWRLSSYRFPTGVPLPDRLPLGELERTGGDHVRYTATLLSGGEEPPRLLLEDRKVQELHAEARELRRQLVELRRRRRAEPKKAVELDHERDVLAARLRLLEEGIASRQRPAGPLEIHALPADSSAEKSAVPDARLIEVNHEAVILVKGLTGAVRFPLPADL